MTFADHRYDVLMLSVHQQMFVMSNKKCLLCVNKNATHLEVIGKIEDINWGRVFKLWLNGRILLEHFVINMTTLSGYGAINLE